jgi:cysteine desulfurase
MTFAGTLYFDHQATTPVDQRVLQKMLPFFSDKAGNPHSSDHIVGWQSARAVKTAAQGVADLIGADADEIFFTSGATESNNLALLGLGKRQPEPTRRRLLVSAIEHKCVLAAAHILNEQFGYQVEVLPVDKDGRLSVRTLTEALDETVLAVSVMAVNNEVGTIQDIKALSASAHQVGAVFHCDAAQAPVAIEMNDFARDVDLLSLSAHKMYGPQGIGALYVRRELHDRLEPLIYGGGQQAGLRSGTVPVPLCVGMAAAAEIMQAQEAAPARQRLGQRRDRFVKLVCQLPWEVTVNGPAGPQRHPGNTNLRFPGFSAQDILQSLQPKLAASTGSACTSGIPEPSHVLKALGLTTDEAEASVRFSLGFETLDEDVDTAVRLLDDTLKKLRNHAPRTHEA